MRIYVIGTYRENNCLKNSSIAGLILETERIMDKEINQALDYQPCSICDNHYQKCTHSWEALNAQLKDQMGINWEFARQAILLKERLKSTEWMLTEIAKERLQSAEEALKYYADYYSASHNSVARAHFEKYGKKK